MSGRGFDTAFLDKVRQTNDIVSTISNYVQVTRKGRNFWCNCPFHHEKTPSLCINDTPDWVFFCISEGKDLCVGTTGTKHTHLLTSHHDLYRVAPLSLSRYLRRPYRARNQSMADDSNNMFLLP